MSREGKSPAFVVIHGVGETQQCHKSQMLYSHFYGVKRLLAMPASNSQERQLGVQGFGLREFYLEAHGA